MGSQERPVTDDVNERSVQTTAVSRNVVVRLHRAAACAVAVIRTFGCAAALDTGATRSSCRAVQPDFAPRPRQIEAARGTAQQAGILPNPRFDTNNPQVFNGRNTLLNVGAQMEIPVMGKRKLDQAAATEVARQTEHNYFQIAMPCSPRSDSSSTNYSAINGASRCLLNCWTLSAKPPRPEMKRYKDAGETKSEYLLLLID